MPWKRLSIGRWLKHLLQCDAYAIRGRRNQLSYVGDKDRRALVSGPGGEVSLVF